MFNCVPTEDGSTYMRADLSLRCASPEGPDPTYVALSIYAAIMIAVHVIGYPLFYSYLFFWRFRSPLATLQAQELAGAHLEKYARLEGVSDEQKATLEVLMSVKSASQVESVSQVYQSDPRVYSTPVRYLPS